MENNSKSAPIEKTGSPKIKGLQREAKFKLRCRGGEIVRVDVRCIYESEELYDLLEDIDETRKEDDPDPRFDVDPRDIGYSPRDIQSPKHIVSMVESFCLGRCNIMETYGHQHVDLFSKKLGEFNSEFVRDKPLSILALLLSAAIQLKIKSLMNLVRDAIVDMHGGKFANGFSNFFNMPYYIKMSKVRFYVYDDWAMDGIGEIPFEPDKMPKRKRKKQKPETQNVPKSNQIAATKQIQKTKVKKHRRVNCKVGPCGLHTLAMRIPF
uniref:uncharacterized protein LOC122599227 n=1 Tax=Erigeron canadensis TaxID=72917 RepID=UPI001CB8A683|nr:uncharacterized protein LOC122599227 [Erigeron canadensis]